ncbi:MAG: hypothetical protein IPN71_03890 [Fibrobacteres bacterium]|jgi:hypothetical protein|nr:hypothetical protein [Fibrobacterota bacterium]
MHLLTICDCNHFALKLFPNPDGIDFRITEITLKNHEEYLLKLTTKNQPTLDVKKWGTWQIDYNNIVFCISSFFSYGGCVSNWDFSEAATMDITKSDDTFTFNAQAGNGKISFFSKSFVIQGQHTFLD